MNKKDQFHKTYEDMTPKDKINYLENKNQYLEAENQYLKNCELQCQYLLKILIEILGLKRSIYYYTLSKTHKDIKNNEIMNIIIDIFYEHKERYDYR